jgi:hypothetical protein
MGCNIICGETSSLSQFTLAEPTIPIDITPDTLNLRSHGEWITCYLEPVSYSVTDVDIHSIRLDETLEVDPEAPSQIGDYDNDGVTDLMVKFDRPPVIAHLGVEDESEDTAKSIDVTLEIIGHIIVGTTFQGSNTMKVVLKG